MVECELCQQPTGFGSDAVPCCRRSNPVAKICCILRQADTVESTAPEICLCFIVQYGEVEPLSFQPFLINQCYPVVALFNLVVSMAPLKKREYFCSGLPGCCLEKFRIIRFIAPESNPIVTDQDWWRANGQSGHGNGRSGKFFGCVSMHPNVFRPTIATESCFGA